MRFLGLEISRAKAATPVTDLSWANTGPWYPVIREPFAGAWQRNMELRPELLIAYPPVFACITLRASDVAKCDLRLMEVDENDIWTPVESPAFSPVLRRPNRVQNRIQFFQQWMTCKDLYGNVYVLKERDARGVVVAMYILDPRKVKVLVAPDGEVYYQLGADNLTGIDLDRTVPAREIIHDMTTLRYHALCGIPPMAAAMLPASQGRSIQTSASSFFDNGARPSGILSTAGAIDDATAKRLKDHWEAGYTGKNAGKVAVLGDGLKFEPITAKASDSQTVEQLGLTGKMVCTAFNVPAYMIGVADPPPYNNIEALNQQYYSQCLQKDFESIELLLDEGLGLVNVVGRRLRTAFDTDGGLLRMDSKTAAETEKALAGIKAPNEQRKRFNLKPLAGGNSVYLQEQNYSLEALAKRDAKPDPFDKSGSEPAPAPAAAEDEPAADALEEAAKNQIARWSLKDYLDDELRKMAA